MSKTISGRPPKHARAMGDPIGIRLPSELVAKIDEATQERGWTRNEEIRRRLTESFSPLSDEAGAMANVLGLIVQQIQELTGKPLHTDPFSWVALHSALRLLIPADPPGVTIPEMLAAEAAAMHDGDDVDSHAREFAEGIGTRVWATLIQNLKHVDKPNYTAGLPPGRRRFLEAIHQDFQLHKLWANTPKSGFVPLKPAKGLKSRKQEKSK